MISHYSYLEKDKSHLDHQMKKLKQFKDTKTMSFVSFIQGKMVHGLGESSVSQTGEDSSQEIVGKRKL